MVMVEDVSNNNYDPFTLRTDSSEYTRILKITPIFTNLHIMEGK
jgi:hypothetical protein